MIKIDKCSECGTKIDRWTQDGKGFCVECRQSRREQRKKRITLPCEECGAPVECSGPNGLEQARKGRAFCSTEHQQEWRAKLSSKTMAKTNRKYASARMTARNPMARPSVREKVSATLKAMNWKPTVRGGNGQPLPLPQLRLSKALKWPTEWIVRTGQKGNGLPTHFKVDIANPNLMIAIEVDGFSHVTLARKEQDGRKEAFLRGHGWTVLRFLNRDVMEDLAACVQTVMSTISKLKKST